MPDFLARPTPRARHGRWGTYNPGWYTAYKKAITAVYVANKLPGEFNKDQPFQFVYLAAIPKPKTSKLLVPKGDVDNYAKGFLDAGNDIVWKDDKQCNLLVGYKRWTHPGEPPNVTLWIGQASPCNQVYDLLNGSWFGSLRDLVSKTPIQLCGDKKRASPKPRASPKRKSV